MKTVNDKRSLTIRIIFYILGLAIQSFGLTLNTKTGLGVSAVIVFAYAVSQIAEANFGNATFVLFGVFIAGQMVIHAIMHRQGRELASGSLKKQLVMDVLQFPMAYVLTRFMNFISWVLPQFDTDFPGSFWGSVFWRIVLTLIAIVCTGVGAAMSLNMRIIPNSGDGIVQALSDISRKKLGLTKNIFDITSICVTLITGFLFAGTVTGINLGGLVFSEHQIGVGIGTILSMIGVGRVVALYNKLFFEKQVRAAGVSYGL